MTLNKKVIMEFVKERAGHPVPIKEMMKPLGIPKEMHKGLRRLLEEMVNEGELVRIKGDRYGVPSKMNLVVGRLQGHPDGFGFVIPDKDGDDVYIKGKNLGEAMHGDHVVARVEGVRRGGKREGRIIRVMERKNSTLVGRLEKGKRFGYVVPDEKRIWHDIYIPAGEDRKADDGDVVLVEITGYPARGRNPEGRVMQVIGRPDDPEVEIQSIIIRHDLPSLFPEDVMAEAGRVADTVSDKDIEGRVDLRDMPTVTIDGETARDFDDAVSVKREKNGNIRLWVSIADVSHYVREGTSIDEESCRRGTSVYFPGRCIPMLPERLSNGICSLNPGVDRLAMTAEMVFNERGERLERRFYTGVIRSDYRLTYTEVRKILIDGESEVSESYSKIIPDLKTMEELCGRLRSYREGRGCIDFDLPEPQIIIDIEGGVEAIVRSERNLAHMIIEEFMLAANEAVASFLSDREYPLLYRVHEEPNPEKIDDFREFIHNFGYALKGGNPKPRDIQGLLKKVSGRPEERTINHVLLRSMKQAVYSDKNIGHFGLASDEYCHFTSPIRRYPDLVVHRILKEVISGSGMDRESKEKLSERLPKMGENTSRLERRAMEAERDVVDLMKAKFMVDKVGEEYNGFITGVTSFGLFVELEELFVEGLVHVTSLSDDYYIYDEKGHTLTGEKMKKRFRIGDGARVRVEKVDINKRQIDFSLVKRDT